MKKTKKIIPMVLLFIGAILTLVTTVSAAKLGDPYTWQGVQIGWVLVIATIVIAIILWYTLKSAPFKKAVPILVIVCAAGLVLGLTDVAIEPAAITDDVTWDVTCASDTDDITIDNDARTITKLIYADATNEVINATDDSVWVAADDDPWLNFTITPSMAVGISTTTNQATTNCAVLNPDKTFTEDSTSYALFEEVSSGGDRNVPWTTDGTDDYESKLCTVTIGSSEVAQLKINYLDDGLSQFEAGESQAFVISIGGISYTMTVIVTALT